MRADRDIAVAQFAGDDLDLLLGRRVFDPQQIFGQHFAEAAVDFADGVGRDGAALEAAAVDPLLDVDVRFGLELEVALLGVLAVVALEGALDIDRVRVVAFDQVAVVAVHRPHEIGERGQQAFGQGAPEAGALLRQLQGEIGQGGAVARAFADQQRLHQADGFTPVCDRFYVRFYVRFFPDHILLYIKYMVQCNWTIRPLKSPV